MQSNSIRDNYYSTLERIEKARQAAGREAGCVKLIVVTKGQPLHAIQAVLEAGAGRLGENYVEEAIGKIQTLSGQFKVEWHMIGHVQSRKARPVCQHFAWLHSLDSLKIAQRLDRFARELQVRLPTLLECNVSGEASKYGWPAWDESSWMALAEGIAPVFDLEGLCVYGLMTMAPFLDDPEEARPFFERLRKLQSFFARQFPSVNWQELSMGMSADFEAAIKEGATMVRIGTAIMGPRFSSN
jgi:pyridoxal phosphate enzyme (YggS family)